MLAAMSPQGRWAGALQFQTCLAQERFWAWGGWAGGSGQGVVGRARLGRGQRWDVAGRPYPNLHPLDRLALIQAAQLPLLCSCYLGFLPEETYGEAEAHLRSTLLVYYYCWPSFEKKKKSFACTCLRGWLNSLCTLCFGTINCYWFRFKR